MMYKDLSYYESIRAKKCHECKLKHKNHEALYIPLENAKKISRHSSSFHMQSAFVLTVANLTFPL